MTYSFRKDVHDWFCGWIAPDGGLYDKTIVIRTHEHLAELILEDWYGLSPAIKGSARIMMTNKLLIELGWVRYDWEVVWLPKALTPYQRDILTQLDNLMGWTPRKIFRYIFNDYTRTYKVLKGKWYA